MGVDGSRARLQPNPRGFRRLSNGFADHPGGVDPRVENLAPIFGGITTIHTAPGEIHDDIGTVDFTRPIAQTAPVPAHQPAGRVRAWLASQNHHLVPVRLECSSEDRTHLPRATWDDDFHWGSVPPVNVFEFGAKRPFWRERAVFWRGTTLLARKGCFWRETALLARNGSFGAKRLPGQGWAVFSSASLRSIPMDVLLGTPVVKAGK